jgi:hypothetical protein
MREHRAVTTAELARALNFTDSGREGSTKAGMCVVLP